MFSVAALLCIAQITGGYDELIQRLLDKYHIAGASVAVAKNGRIVLARGYGLADPEKGERVRSDSLFRIASLSKPITSAAVLKLVEENKLKLNDRAFEILNLGPPSDERMKQITIRQLLLHSGGWDRDSSFDPMFIPRKAANAVGAPVPASCETVIRYMLTQLLQFDPGSKYSYSNFGYCVLGRVIEKVTGQSYEQYVKSAILSPSGIHRMQIGHTRLEQRAAGEVRYVDETKMRSVFPSDVGPVSTPYGGFYLEAMDSHGGWIASATDLVRFMMHLDGAVQPVTLKPDTVAQMIARPRIATDPNTWYGFGWQVRRAGNDANWWHNGALDGTLTMMVRTCKGLHWAVLFNGRPKNSDQFVAELDRGMWIAAEPLLR